jgi:D-amino-acid oxidase
MSARLDIIVVGCGVSGLTTGLALVEAGYQVRIVSRDLPWQTTSAVAAAYWYPYKAFPEDRVLAWGARTLDRLYELVDQPDSGVAIRPFTDLFEKEVPDPWWKEAVRVFRRATPDELRKGYVDGFTAEAPLAETPVYLDFLLRRFRDKGGVLDHRPEGIRTLTELCAPDTLIVNCTGLGSRKLLGDEELYPIRGQVVRVTNPGLTDGFLDESGRLALTYIVPRRVDVVLGGTAEDNEWGTDADPAVMREILSKCLELEPRLRGQQVLGTRVGLRPARSAVRLEIEETEVGCPLVHNYGHGGAGFTLSWGCAEKVVELVRDVDRRG